MLFSRRRVEEDLERIRKANLPAEKQAEEEKQQQAARENASRLEKGDLLAMMIAFFSVVLPYILIFIGVMAVLVLLMALIFR